MNVDFPWGKVTHVHDIAGKYEIVEYICAEPWAEAGETQFHTANGSYDTLEQAMLSCVCSCYSPDEHLFEYAFRLIAGVIK